MSEEKEDLSEKAEKVMRASLTLSEAYCRWVFAPKNTLSIEFAGDAIREAFLAYLEIAHPNEAARVRLAEAGLVVPGASQN